MGTETAITRNKNTDFFGRIPDVLAKSKQQEKYVAGECKACEINKVIEYLTNKNVELWVFPEIANKTIFIFKRGENWKQFKSLYDSFYEKWIYNLKQEAFSKSRHSTKF